MRHRYECLVKGYRKSLVVMEVVVKRLLDGRRGDGRRLVPRQLGVLYLLGQVLVLFKELFVFDDTRLSVLNELLENE